MKAFFQRYSYDSVRMLLNQFAIAIFGFSLALATVGANRILMLLTSIGATIFYLALNYGVAWRAGSKDKSVIDRGILRFRPAQGLLIALLANSLSFLLAIITAVGLLFGADGLAAVVGFFTMFVNGMYHGVIFFFSGSENALFVDFWWIYLLTPLLSMGISFVGYIAGVKDFHITKMGIPDLPASDRPTKQELREKKKAEKENQNKS